MIIILSGILIFIGIVLLYFVITFYISGLSFKDFGRKWKDVTYWQKKYNDSERELEIQREAHARNTIAWTKRIEELISSDINKTTKLQIANKEINKMKERIKELEKC